MDTGIKSLLYGVEFGSFCKEGPVGNPGRRKDYKGSLEALIVQDLGPWAPNMGP